jgi:hypothetical protein
MGKRNGARRGRAKANGTATEEFRNVEMPPDSQNCSQH